MTDPASPVRGSVAELDNFWVRSRIGWNAVYLGLLVLVALFTVFRDDLTVAAKLVALALLAAMAATYLLVGRHLLGEDCGARSLVQVALTWACFYGLVIVSSGGTGEWGGPEYILLFMLFPQIWAYLSTRRAVVATIIVTTGLAVTAIGRSGWDREAVTGVLPSILLQLGLALLLGLFITGVINQAERRAVLIDELERTRAELATTEHARGVLAERERLAREIHDTLAQNFTSILTLSQATEVALPPDATTARERLSLIERTARDGLAEAKALVGALSPVDLQDASLAEAVERVVARFGEETGVPAEVTVSGRPRSLPANYEVVLLRTTQEALANVRRHAAARAVRVTLNFPPDGPGSASVEVTDDGQGFDPLDVSGYGLHGMRSRVEQVGGTLEVTSGVGSGTSIRVFVP
jgi:signal transduction histidine kinase